MQDNVVSLTGAPVVAGDPIREEFLAFAAECYDTFARATGDRAQSYVLTMATDRGVFDSFWSNTESILPSTAVLGFALAALTTAVAEEVRDYRKPKD